MKKQLALVWAVICLFSFGKAIDYRPAFDKSGYRKTVWAHVNPWWSPAKRRYDDSGGADYAFRCYESSSQWCEAFKDMCAHGVRYFQWELNVPAPAYATKLQEVIKQCRANGVDCKFGLFMVWYGRQSLEKEIERTLRQFDLLKDEFRNEPYLFRLNGCPVVSVYTPHFFKPEEWKKVMAAVEEKYGKFIWLMNTCGNPAEDADPVVVGKFLHEYLPYFDGITQYANYTEHSQKRHYEILAPIMHNEFPQKIFEAALQNTYSNHHWFGGAFTHLSRKWRQCIDCVLKAEPDSIGITNMFDHFEQSHVLPSYERENFLLRYAMAALSEWRGVSFKGEYTPELALNSYICVQLGRQNLDFEVIGFPIHPGCAGAQPVVLHLDICDTAGKVLYTFPEKVIDVSRLCVAEFSVPSVRFAQERGVIPRLRYRWAGRDFRFRHGPMTLIEPSIRTNVMFWSRSNRNELICDRDDGKWSISGVGGGGTLQYPGNGVAAFTASMRSLFHNDPLKRTGDCSYRIMRNGVECYQSYKHPGFDGTRVIDLPSPGEALNWYHVEIENSRGYRCATLPIWVTNNTRAGKVTLPIMSEGKVCDVEIEAARVPFFYYPCSFDSGSILADVSGYMHNGGFSGPYLDTIGYNHYYNGVGAAIKEKLFERDSEGRGYLHLPGTRSALLMGGTAFPGASTYEISIRPAEIGKAMGVFGSINNQLNVTVLPDGRVKVQRKAEKEGEGGSAAKTQFSVEILSRKALKAGEWTKLAIVYDLKELRLYIDGVLEGRCACPVAYGHDALNPMTVGSLLKGVSDRFSYFVGDIREIRLYGRNLSPEEML